LSFTRRSFPSALPPFFLFPSSSRAHCPLPPFFSLPFFFWFLKLIAAGSFSLTVSITGNSIALSIGTIYHPPSHPFDTVTSSNPRALLVQATKVGTRFGKVTKPLPPRLLKPASSYRAIVPLAVRTDFCDRKPPLWHMGKEKAPGAPTAEKSWDTYGKVRTLGPRSRTEGLALSLSTSEDWSSTCTDPPSAFVVSTFPRTKTVFLRFVLRDKCLIHTRSPTVPHQEKLNIRPSSSCRSAF